MKTSPLCGHLDKGILRHASKRKSFPKFGPGFRSAKSNGAFSLVELLVVLAIGGLLVAFASPALTSLNNAGSVNRAVNGISLALDEARAYAMAHNTYVWVGFYPNVTTQVLTVGVVAGTTGELGDLSSPQTYSPVLKLQTYNFLALKNGITGLTGMASSQPDITASTIGSFQETQGGQSVTFSEVLQFSPRGEASIKTTGNTAHWIQIGLQPSLRNNDPNEAVFQVASLTGQVQIFRP